MGTNNNERRFEVIEGDRARLEAEIVEDLFLGRYDPAKAARLDCRGRLTLVADATEDRSNPSGQSALHR
jgi:hypothetical protein